MNINFGDTSKQAEEGDKVHFENGKEFDVINNEGELGIRVPSDYFITEENRTFLTDIGVKIFQAEDVEEPEEEEDEDNGGILGAIAGGIASMGSEDDTPGTSSSESFGGFGGGSFDGGGASGSF